MNQLRQALRSNLSYPHLLAAPAGDLGPVPSAWDEGSRSSHHLEGAVEGPESGSAKANQSSVDASSPIVQANDTHNGDIVESSSRWMSGLGLDSDGDSVEGIDQVDATDNGGGKHFDSSIEIENAELQDDVATRKSGSYGIEENSPSGYETFQDAESANSLASALAMQRSSTQYFLDEVSAIRKADMKQIAAHKATLRKRDKEIEALQGENRFLKEQIRILELQLGQGDQAFKEHMKQMRREAGVQLTMKPSARKHDYRAFKPPIVNAPGTSAIAGQSQKLSTTNFTADNSSVAMKKASLSSNKDFSLLSSFQATPGAQKEAARRAVAGKGTTASKKKPAENGLKMSRPVSAPVRRKKTSARKDVSGTVSSATTLANTQDREATKSTNTYSSSLMQKSWNDISGKVVLPTHPNAVLDNQSYWQSLNAKMKAALERLRSGKDGPARKSSGNLSVISKVIAQEMSFEHFYKVIVDGLSHGLSSQERSAWVESLFLELQTFGVLLSLLDCIYSMPNGDIDQASQCSSSIAHACAVMNAQCGRVFLYDEESTPPSLILVAESVLDQRTNKYVTQGFGVSLPGGVPPTASGFYDDQDTMLHSKRVDGLLRRPSQLLRRKNSLFLQRDRNSDLKSFVQSAPSDPASPGSPSIPSPSSTGTKGSPAQNKGNTNLSSASRGGLYSSSQSLKESDSENKKVNNTSSTLGAEQVIRAAISQADECGLANAVFEKGISQDFPAARANSSFSSSLDQPEGVFTESALGAPLFDHIGRKRGVILVYNKQSKTTAERDLSSVTKITSFNELDRVFLSELARHAGKEFSLSQKYIETWQLTHSLSVLHRYTPVLHSREDLAMVLDKLFKRLQSFLTCQHYQLWIVEQDPLEQSAQSASNIERLDDPGSSNATAHCAKKLRCILSSRSNDDVSRVIRQKDGGVTWQTFMSKKELMMPIVSRHRQFNRRVDGVALPPSSFTSQHVEDNDFPVSMITCPLKNLFGDCIGVAVFYNKSAGTRTVDSQGRSSPSIQPNGSKGVWGRFRATDLMVVKSFTFQISSFASRLRSPVHVPQNCSSSISSASVASAPVSPMVSAYHSSSAENALDPFDRIDMEGNGLSANQPASDSNYLVSQSCAPVAVAWRKGQSDVGEDQYSSIPMFPVGGEFECEPDVMETALMEQAESDPSLSTIFQGRQETGQNAEDIYCTLAIEPTSDDSTSLGQILFNMKDLVKEMCHAINAEHLRVWMVTQSALGSCLINLFGDNFDCSMQSMIGAPRQLYQINQGTAGLSARELKTVNVVDPCGTLPDSFHPSMDRMAQKSFRCVLCSPLISSATERKAVGVLQAINKKGAQAFSADDEFALQVFSCQISRLFLRKPLSQAESVSRELLAGQTGSDAIEGLKRRMTNVPTVAKDVVGMKRMKALFKEEQQRSSNTHNI